MALINDFRSKLVGGGARPTQFQVDLTFPGGDLFGFTSRFGTDAARSSSFLVKATTLPQSIITPIDVPYRGRVAKIAGERQFANWSVTILNDNDFVIRRALESWSRAILNHSSTNGSINPVNYVTNQTTVTQLDRNDQPLRKYQFFNLYPQAIGEIQLDFGAVNNIEEYQVEFSVDYWEIIPV